MPKETQTNSETPEEQMDPFQAQAEAIKQTATAAALATCLSKTFGKVIGSNGFKTYVETTLEAAGTIKDPIERMLTEQLIVAHHRITELHAESACADTPKIKELYNAAALRLLNEFRKTALALREYRTPVASKSLTLVNQQNVASGNQQIAYVDGDDQNEEKPSRTKLVSNTNPKALTHDAPITLDITTESTARRSRETQFSETRGVDPRRTETLAGSDQILQTVDTLHRAENSEGEKTVRR